MPSKGLFHRFEDTWIPDGVRTPMVTTAPPTWPMHASPGSDKWL